MPAAGHLRPVCKLYKSTWFMKTGIYIHPFLNWRKNKYKEPSNLKGSLYLLYKN
jgi:hypothetical protein